jgi:GTP-binding protein EngB required for normal cell division
MTQAFENRRGVLQDALGQPGLQRLAELATQFGAAHIASTALSTAERVSEGRFYVACVGQFKRGKSTLLNALIGHAVLPTAVVPVTAVPTIIRHGKQLAARVRLQSETWTDIAVSAVEEYVSEEKNPENAKGVVGVEIFVPSPLLETGMCLVDTPGLGSVFAGNTAATQAFIPHIDVAVIVIGTDPPLSGDEFQLVQAVSQEVHDLVFVLNKADKVNAAERAVALDFTRRVLETRLQRVSPVIYEVSALDWLERTGPERDWTQLNRALEDLVLRSGRALVRNATDRGIRRAARELLAVIKEDRGALERPLEESERRIAMLRKTLEESEVRARDLGILLTAEQQSLSRVFLERRNAFLKRAQAACSSELTGRLSAMARRHNGPAYRRSVNHTAQEIARAQLTRWFESEAKFADEKFRKTAKRFVELANEFLKRLGESGLPGLEELPEDFGADERLSSKSQFRFHVIERVAAPASPLLFVSDFVLGGVGIRGGIARDAQEFLDQLLEVNASRVQSDVDERLRESRKRLEVQIEAVMQQAWAIADRALAHARVAQSAGVQAVETALSRLRSIEHEILELSRSR